MAIPSYLFPMKASFITHPPAFPTLEKERKLSRDAVPLLHQLNHPATIPLRISCSRSERKPSARPDELLCLLTSVVSSASSYRSISQHFTAQ